MAAGTPLQVCFLFPITRLSILGIDYNQHAWREVINSLTSIRVRGASLTETGKGLIMIHDNTALQTLWGFKNVFVGGAKQYWESKIVIFRFYCIFDQEFPRSGGIPSNYGANSPTIKTSLHRGNFKTSCPIARMFCLGSQHLQIKCFMTNRKNCPDATKTRILITFRICRICFQLSEAWSIKKELNSSGVNFKNTQKRPKTHVVSLFQIPHLAPHRLWVLFTL